MADASEKEFLGSKRSKIWTYLVLALALVVGVIIANFAISNPDTAKHGIKSIAGLPSWAFPFVLLLIGAALFAIGLKVESDWPEGIGAGLIGAAALMGEILIGWKKFYLGGLWVVPMVLPLVIFLILLLYGMSRSR